MPKTAKTAVIAGVGPALGASLCRAFSRQGYTVTGLCRHSEPLPPTFAALNNDLDKFVPLSADLTDKDQVEAAFTFIEREQPPLRVAIYNVAQFHMNPFDAVDPDIFEAVWRASAYGAMVFAKTALPLMMAVGGGTLIFTGATASVRGGKHFSAFASAKFALRGLAQSLAREYGPRGVHVAHVIVDGMIGRSAASSVFRKDEDRAISPDELADIYTDLARQKPSAWTQELDVRPATETY